MGLFTFAEMASLRGARAEGWTMAQMCHLMRAHTRDEVVEALDALVRETGTQSATERVNRVLVLQGAQVPLINGREAYTVSPDRGRKSYGVR